MIIFYCLLLIIVQLFSKSLNLLISDGTPDDLPTLPTGRTDLAGGRNGVNLTDPEQRVSFERLAVYAVELIEYQERNQNLPAFSVVRIKSGATQVVAGAAYEMIFYAGEKMCANERVAVDYMVQNADATNMAPLPCLINNDSSNRSRCVDCTIDVNGQFALCHVRLVVVPWEKKADVTEYKCVKTTRDQVYDVSNFPTT